MLATEVARIHTFGISVECDMQLCELMAYHGLGSSCHVTKNYELSGAVVGALKKAMDTSLENCTIQWGNYEEEELGCVFRNELVQRTMNMET